jgi:hypothetical protein
VVTERIQDLIVDHFGAIFVDRIPFEKATTVGEIACSALDLIAMA